MMEMISMVVNCEDCKNDFELKLQTEQVDDNCERVFFDCPYCTRRYITQYTNDKIREKQARIREMREEYNNARGIDTDKAVKIFEKYEKLKKEIKTDMENLIRR